MTYRPENDISKKKFKTDLQEFDKYFLTCYFEISSKQFNQKQIKKSDKKPQIISIS